MACDGMNVWDKQLKKVFIVAEIGNNHNGDIETAKRMIDAAVDAGADAVKIQSFRGIDIITPNIPASEYPAWNVTEYTYWADFLDSIALPMDKHEAFFLYARERGIQAFSTPTSSKIVDMLEELDAPFYKIASMDITNLPLLRRVARTQKPVILSTGMGDRPQIEAAVQCFDKNLLLIMHCVSDYPLDYRNANLRSIQYLARAYGCPVGFSDHSLGYDLDIAAVACGARAIEKHITLSRQTDKKVEHHFALEPRELRELVGKIRDIEAALGSEEVELSDNEKTYRFKALRSLHVASDLPRGHVLGSDDVLVLRPGDGTAPETYDLFIGKKLSRDMKAWEPLTESDV